MEFKKLAYRVKIPVLGIGTWRMGGDLKTIDTSHDEQWVSAIKNAIRAGMTHIDTAERYARGHAEELVGKAIKEFDRKKLFITTKVRPENLRHSDLISAAKNSLKRLGTNYIDLYLVHEPNPNIHIKETMKTMDYLVENKLVRFIGLSNFSLEQLKEAQQFSNNKIVAVQIEYNLLTRNKGQFTKNMESKIIPYCQKNNITVIAYRPLAEGKLAKPGIPLLDKLAEKYGKTQAQIAINWLISKPNIVTIVKATKTEHIMENLGAIGWRLNSEDISKLDNEFPSRS
jgi:diketogulonate reductase-like aldo/keto reductase